MIRTISLLISFVYCCTTIAQNKMQVHSNGEIIIDNYVGDIDSIKFDNKTSIFNRNLYDNYSYVTKNIDSVTFYKSND